MTLPVNYADGSSTVHGADLNAWDAAINALTNTLTPGYATTVTSGSPVTLVNTSPSFQVFTGSTAQTVLLPTTGVVAGALGFIVNNSTAAITVQSSGANTINIVAAGAAGMFTAQKATPTAAADWESTYWGDVVASGKSLTVSNTLTIAGTDGTSFTFPAVGGTVVAPPAAVNTLTSTVATSGVNETKIFSSNQIPANTLSVGSTIRFKIFGALPASASTTFKVWVGTSGTTGDTALATCTSSCGLGLGVQFEGQVTMRTITSTGVCAGSAILQAGTAVSQVSTQSATVTVDTTKVAYVTVSAKVSTSTFTCYTAVMSMAGA